MANLHTPLAEPCRGSALLGFVGADAAALSTGLADDAVLPAGVSHLGRQPATPASPV